MPRKRNPKPPDDPVQPGPATDPPQQEQAVLAKVRAKPSRAAALRQVVTWICEGHSAEDIAESMAEDFAGIKAKPVIAAAVRNLANEGTNVDEALIRGFALEGTRIVYQRTLEVGDHQTALRALKQLVELASK